MDTSELYILKCEKADEIQNQWIPHNFDKIAVISSAYINKIWSTPENNEEIISLLNENTKIEWNICQSKKINTLNGDYIGKYKDFVFDFSGCDDPYYSRILLYNAIWLPRQDQLQEIVSKKHGDVLNQLQAIWIYVNSFKKEPLSFEQMWLEAIMYWEYNKIWEDNEWLELKIETQFKSTFKKK